MTGRALKKCAAHGLAFDPSTASGCVLCRKSSVPAPAATGKHPVVVGLALVAAIAGGLGGGYAVIDTLARSGSSIPGLASLPGNPSTNRSATVAPNGANARARLAPDELPELDGALATQNSSGRSGVFFLPVRTAFGPIPVLVALHGSTGDGASMIGPFRGLAQLRRFAIVAPSSGYVAKFGVMTWTVGDHPNDVTDDYRHVQACFEEVATRTDVTFDRSRVLIAGFSGGGSSAPYIASNTGPYDAFAVLHGGAYPGGIGPRRVRGWFAAGDTDGIRTRDHVAAQFRSIEALGFDVSFHVFPGGHFISPAEVSALVEWWLGPPAR